MDRERFEASHDELWHRFHRKDEENPFEKKDRYFRFRQLLNIVFILMTIAGIILWFRVSRDVASYVLICGIAFKFLELSMRIMKL
ncbi:MAG: hypothetical protein IJ081_01540 [Prevotella sp.]|jgi:hypothetical protein|nr:hypothetical protein [Prevotella sp.]